MCLSKAKRIFPEEDIVCYKVLQKTQTYPIRYFSPYYNTKEWTLGKVEALRKRTDACTVVGCFSSEKLIYGGAYHTYSSLLAAQQFADRFSSLVVVKCIIPKSSKYVYKGTISDGKEGFASQKLKPIKVVYE